MSSLEGPADTSPDLQPEPPPAPNLPPPPTPGPPTPGAPAPPPPGAPSADAPTRSNRPLHWAIAILAVIIGAEGLWIFVLNDGDDSADRPGIETTASTAPDSEPPGTPAAPDEPETTPTTVDDNRRDRIDLADALLEPTDGSYRVRDAGASEIYPGRYEAVDGCDAFVDLLNASADGWGERDVEEAHLLGNLGEELDHVLTWLEDTDTPIEEVKAALADCETYRWEGDDATSTMVLDDIPIDGVGDDVYGYTLELESSQGWVGILVIVTWVREDARSTIRLAMFGDLASVPAELVDAAHDAASTADAKLADLLEAE